MKVTPYKSSEETKKQQVATMFDTISPRYDVLNHTLSLGIDRLWRKKAIRVLSEHRPKHILDVATGTADLALAAHKLQPESIVGVDISEGMLSYGREKIKKQQLEKIIRLQWGDSEQLPFEDASFDAVMAAFGVRNFEHLEAGLAEMQRVLKPGGILLVLEFSQPTIFPFKQLYNFYFSYILPKLGAWISKDDRAYTYLPESVRVFPYGKAFTDILDNLAFKSTKCYPLTLGISSIYTGIK